MYAASEVGRRPWTTAIAALDLALAPALSAGLEVHGLDRFTRWAG